MSHFHIRGAKRISQHLSELQPGITFGLLTIRELIRCGQMCSGNLRTIFSVALEPLISARRARRPFAFWDAKSSKASKSPGRRRFKNFDCPCPVLISFTSELHDETQHGPDHESRNCDGADRHEIDGSKPNHLSRAWIHHSQPFSGVLPRNTL